MLKKQKLQGEKSMGKYEVLGFSTVAKLWKKVYNEVKPGDDISTVIAQCGQPDRLDNFDCGVQHYYWISEEFKGWCRGGTWYRKMAFSVENGKILDKSSLNLDLCRY